MKSVAMIAYHFPPEGNAGAHRTLRFTRSLLASSEWRPSIICLSTDVYERYDPNLLSLVPPETKVTRVRNHDPWKALQQWRGTRIQQKLSGVSVERARKIREAHEASLRSWIREAVRKLETWLYHPDAEMGWIRPAMNATLKRCHEESPEVIWATAGPVSSFVVAKNVSDRTRIPYVLDFRDAWTITYNDFEEKRPTWAKRYEQRRMFRLLAKAQSVVFRFRAEAECYWRAYQGALEPSKIYIIPNGYEGTIDEFMPAERERCEILYTGTICDYRYDTLLRAFYLLKQSSPQLANRLHLHFVGEGSEALAKNAAELDLSDMITVRGPTSHEEITKLSKKAHALLILGRPPTMRGYELFAGAKLFGYLKAGMPILGVLPTDETKKVLLRIGVSTVADVDSPNEIVAVLCKIIDEWSHGRLRSLVPNRSACELYSAERQTLELTRALEGAPALEPFVPGGAEVPPSLRSEIANLAQQLGHGNRRPWDGNVNDVLTS